MKNVHFLILFIVSHSRLNAILFYFYLSIGLFNYLKSQYHKSGQHCPHSGHSKHLKSQPSEWMGRIQECFKPEPVTQSLVIHI